MCGQCAKYFVTGHDIGKSCVQEQEGNYEDRLQIEISCILLKEIGKEKIQDDPSADRYKRKGQKQGKSSSKKVEEVTITYAKIQIPVVLDIAVV